MNFDVEYQPEDCRAFVLREGGIVAIAMVSAGSVSFYDTLYSISMDDLKKLTQLCAEVDIKLAEMM